MCTQWTVWMTEKNNHVILSPTIISRMPTFRAEFLLWTRDPVLIAPLLQSTSFTFGSHQAFTIRWQHFHDACPMRHARRVRVS
jgi:hypothetical protein